MIFKPLALKGAYLIDLEIRGDDRGLFVRYWCNNEFGELGLDTNIVQINNSMSRYKGTLRGLHFQCSPKAETKPVSSTYVSNCTHTCFARVRRIRFPRLSWRFGTGFVHRFCGSAAISCKCTSSSPKCFNPRRLLQLSRRRRSKRFWNPRDSCCFNHSPCTRS